MRPANDGARKGSVAVKISGAVLIYLSAIFASSLLAQDEHSAKRVRELLQPFMQPLVVANNSAEGAEQELVSLGRTLFYDHRLSPNLTHACNSCHALSTYGTGGEYFLKLKEQGRTFRDVPSLYNLKHLQLFGWAGEFKTLTDKIAHALVSEHEMNFSDTGALVKRLTDVNAYRDHFARSFPGDAQAVSAKNISLALQAFINGLITPAPIDRFLSGDDQALSDKQRQGAVAFDRHGCFSCHTGLLVGGQIIMKLGVLEAWPNQADKGYFEISKDPAHVLAFRVAALRNAEKTAPYFHDYSSKRLWDAIGKMARYELGKQLSPEDTDQIQEFIKALTGEIPLDYIKPPPLPE